MTDNRIPLDALYTELPVNERLSQKKSVTFPKIVYIFMAILAGTCFGVSNFFFAQNSV